jgi:transcriptional regulator with XRE-family HTH domain
MTDTSPESINSRVAREVRTWAARRELNQADAAVLIGVSQQGISRRLNGQTPFALDELEVLASAFGIRLAVLLGEPPTVTELRESSPIPDAPRHSPLRARRGRRTTAYKVPTSIASRNRPIPTGYRRAHLLTRGETPHTGRAA